MYMNKLYRKECGLNGREAVLRDYNWDKVSKDWDKLLQEMLK